MQHGNDRVPERRFLPLAMFAVELREGKPAVLMGYASVFYDGTPATEYKLWNGSVERIGKGAFDAALKRDDVRGLYNHDPDHLLGRTSAQTMRLRVDNRGLFYEVDLPDTTLGRDVAESVRRRDLTGSSFSFIVKKETWTEGEDEDVREIEDVELFDVGPVTFPAYAATTTGLRAAGDLSEVKASYDEWRKSRATELKRRQMEMAAQAIEIENMLDK